MSEKLKRELKEISDQQHRERVGYDSLTPAEQQDFDKRIGDFDDEINDKAAILERVETGELTFAEAQDLVIEHERVLETQYLAQW